MSVTAFNANKHPWLEVKNMKYFVFIVKLNDEQIVFEVFAAETH
jgi:hypothetical protein